MECNSGALYKTSQKHTSPSYSEQYANNRTSQEGYWLPLLFSPLSFHYRASCWDLGFFRSPLKASEQRNKVIVDIWKGRFDHWWWQGLKNRGRDTDEGVFSKPISLCSSVPFHINDYNQDLCLLHILMPFFAHFIMLKHSVVACACFFLSLLSWYKFRILKELS